MSKTKETSEKTIPTAGLNLDFSTSPMVWKFLQSKAFVRGVMGPVGSGKSYACCAEIMMKAVQQKPSPIDGIKYSRFAIEVEFPLQLWLQRLRPYEILVDYKPRSREEGKVIGVKDALQIILDLIYFRITKARKRLP